MSIAPACEYDELRWKLREGIVWLISTIFSLQREYFNFIFVRNSGQSDLWEIMTLTDCEHIACCSNMQPIPEQSSSYDVGMALREVVWQAQEQGRLRCGVIECAQLLEIDPYGVMMCVMPTTGTDDVSSSIQQTLIEAFCHEYQIGVIKVDSISKLCKVLQGRATPSGLPPHPPRISTAADMSCVLVQYPENGVASQVEALVTLHCKNAAWSNDNYDATIPLPD